MADKLLGVKKGREEAKIQMKSCEDRGLVEPEEFEESRTKGGIIILDTATEKLRTGKTVEVGPERF